MIRFICILAIFVGESIAIYAEIISSKLAQSSLSVGLFAKSLTLMVIGCVLLLLGYIFGYRTYQNIWIISAISITSILITEPLLNYVIFQEFPTKGAFIGLSLGIIGFAFTIFFK